MSAINTNAQMRYLVQWFEEWSELQRSDFLPILAENYAHKAYVNGIVNSVANIDCRDKPMSIFGCRIKLFKEWFVQWNIETKDAFLKKIGEVDQSFVEKLQNEIAENDALQVKSQLESENLLNESENSLENEKE